MEIFENLSASSRLEPDELDAYSRAVRKVTDSLGPTVISVGTRSGRGGGSGVILGTNDGAATGVTNSHVVRGLQQRGGGGRLRVDRKSTRLNSSHANISYAVFCLKKKKS